MQYCFGGIGNDCLLSIEIRDSLSLAQKRSTNIRAEGDNHVKLIHDHRPSWLLGYILRGTTFLVALATGDTWDTYSLRKRYSIEIGAHFATISRIGPRGSRSTYWTAAE